MGAREPQLAPRVRSCSSSSRPPERRFPRLGPFGADTAGMWCGPASIWVRLGLEPGQPTSDASRRPWDLPPATGTNPIRSRPLWAPCPRRRHSLPCRESAFCAACPAAGAGLLQWEEPRRDWQCVHVPGGRAASGPGRGAGTCLWGGLGAVLDSDGVEAPLGTLSPLGQSSAFHGTC